MTSPDCPIPSEQESLGSCWPVCKAGFSGFGARCLAECPPGFIDHGPTCEPPSVERVPVKASIEACGPRQEDRNGDCFEPQTFGWYNKQIGCGCVRRTLAQRAVCPQGYDRYNGSCLPGCPLGFSSLIDAFNRVVSPVCFKTCPSLSGSIKPWPTINGQCVKEGYSRMGPTPSAAIAVSKPKSMLNTFATKPNGSTVLERYRAGVGPQLLGGTDFISSFFDPAAWDANIARLYKLAIIAAIFAGIFFLGPTLLPGLGQGLGSLFKFAGVGVGRTVAAVGQVAGTAGEIVSAVGKDAAVVIRAPADRLASA